MAKLSVGVPDALVDDLRALAGGNVSAFVTSAIAHELDRRRLFCFLEETDQQLGPVDEDEVGYFSDVSVQTAQSHEPVARRGKAKVAKRRRVS